MNFRRLAVVALVVLLLASWSAAQGQSLPVQTAPAVAGAPVNLAAHIAVYDDDAYQSGNSLTTDSTTVWIGDNNPSASYAGFRFANLAVPRGATIQSAVLQLQAQTSSSSPIKVNLYGDANGTSARFSTGNLPGSRPHTAASVAYNNPAAWSDQSWYGIDVTTVVQEITRRSDWAKGHALWLILKGESGVQNNRRAVAGASASRLNGQHSAQLVITYNVNTGVTPVPTTVTPGPTAVTPAPTGTATATPPPGDVWKPALNSPWQWMIDHALNVNNAKDMGLTDPKGNTLSAPVPQIYDIDGFFNGQDPNCNIKDKNGACVQGENDAVAQLHQMGKKVICYIDAGVYEDYRPDAYKFPASVIGSPDDGWNGSYWLDIRRTDILGPIMKARMQMCKDKGFDAIEPDEIDGYSNDTEFGMTYADQINYNKFIANMAHEMGMSIGLKGDIDQVKDLVNHFDWTLNEECFQYNECNLLKPFSNAGKAVFQVEYKGSTSNFCPTANVNNWNSMLMPLNLNGGRTPCR